MPSIAWMVASTPACWGCLNSSGPVHRPGAHGVEVAGVAVPAVGELLGHHRAGPEREVRHVARQAHQDRATGLGVHAGHRHRVGAQTAAAGAGVAAEHQHVEAPVVGAGDLTVAEHRDDEVALDPDQVRAEEQHGGHREAQEPVEPDDGEPVVLLEGQRLAEPPGVHEEQHPADRGGHQQDAQHAEDEGVGDQVEDRPVPDQAHQQGAHQREHGAEPHAQRDPADLPVAREQLGRARARAGSSPSARRRAGTGRGWPAP